MSEKKRERGPVMRHWLKMMHRFSEDQVKIIYEKASVFKASAVDVGTWQGPYVHVALATSHVHIAMVMAMLHMHRVVHDKSLQRSRD